MRCPAGSPSKGSRDWSKLNLGSSAVTDDALIDLKGLRKLKSLSVHNKIISDDGQPVSVRLTRQQLRRTPADSTGVITAQVPAVVQEELRQCQVVVPQRNEGQERRTDVPLEIKSRRV